MTVVLTVGTSQKKGFNVSGVLKALAGKVEIIDRSVCRTDAA